MHLGEGDRGETEGVERAAHEREAKVALRVDRRGSAHHDEAYRTTATTATHWPRVTRLREQDGDDAREERGRRVQDDVELHTRLVERHVERHVFKRLREAVADRREQQSASHAARPNAQPARRAIGKHPQAADKHPQSADKHLRDAGGEDEEEGRLRGRASVQTAAARSSC